MDRLVNSCSGDGMMGVWDRKRNMWIMCWAPRAGLSKEWLGFMIVGGLWTAS